jgi:hypothetical protein
MSEFHVILRDFRNLASSRRTVVRFNLRWFLLADGRDYGDEIEGCMATVTKDGEIVWTPHLCNRRRIHTISTDLQELVRDQLEESGAMDKARAEYVAREQEKAALGDAIKSQEVGGCVWKEKE